MAVILDAVYRTLARRGANVAEVKTLMESRFPIADAVFILDIDPALSVYRIAHSRGEVPNHFEDRANLAKAREIFNGLIDPKIHHIDGSMSRKAVYSEIIKLFVDGAFKSKRCAKSYGCDDIWFCSFRLTNTCEWWKTQAKLRSAEPVEIK
jgi:dTMP kinase